MTRATHLRRAALAMALVAAGALGGLSLPTQAAHPGKYTWTTAVLTRDADTNIHVRAYNASDHPQEVVVRVRNAGTSAGAVVRSSTHTLQPQQPLNVQFPCGPDSGCPTSLVIQVVAPTDAIVPGARITTAGAARDITAGEFELVGPDGVGTHGAVLGVAGQIEARIDALDTAVGDVQTDIGTVKATVSDLSSRVGDVQTDIGTVKATVSDLSSRVGNRTEAFCAEGSVRNDPQGVLQMYVTLFTDASQQVRIDYITNKGTFAKTVALDAGVRYTDDANATLIGPGAPLDGQGDVDTSVRVVALGGQPVFLACPLYFNRSIGAAGPVAAGHVQDGSSN